jgi:hypothetical protein
MVQKKYGIDNENFLNLCFATNGQPSNALTSRWPRSGPTFLVSKIGNAKIVADE